MSVIFVRVKVLVLLILLEASGNTLEFGFYAVYLCNLKSIKGIYLILKYLLHY